MIHPIYCGPPRYLQKPEPESRTCPGRVSETGVLHLSALTDEIDAKILNLHKDLDAKKVETIRDYQAVVDHLAGNDYLDFRIETIKTDVPQFGKKIPDLERVLQKSSSDSETVSAVVERLKETITTISADPEYDIALDHPEVGQVYDEIRSLEAEKEAISGALNLRSRVLRPGDGGQVTVHLCGICSALLEGDGSPEN